MSLSVVIIDIIFLLLAIVLIWPSIKRIVKYQSVSIADYVIVLIAIFNCIPVFFDVFFGIPIYVYWYRVFEYSLGDFTTCVIYNTYVLVTLSALQLYARKLVRKRRIRDIYEKVFLSKLRKPWLDCLLIILPVIYMIVKYGIGSLLGYTMLSNRGIDSGDSLIINQLITLSIYIYATRFFSEPRTKKEFALMLIFFFLLIWINGKRYMIVTIGEVVFYLYQMTKKQTVKRIKLIPVLTLFGAGVIVFSVFYLTQIKVSMASDYLYGTLRVDFGRDDVTKYVINKVLLERKPILEYPGQSVLADVFMFVPRSIWPGKPYPHYMYLTASILGVSRADIPAGTTPSIFEMNICNFGWAGIVVTILVLIYLCKCSDRSRDLSVKVIMLLIITNLLSQALDAVMVLIPILILLIVQRHVRFTKKHITYKNNTL